MPSLFGRKARPPTVVVVRTAPSSGVALFGTAVSYVELYKRSFAVRAVVDWIARGLARFEPITVDDAGEQLKRDLVAELFRRPAPGVSRFELLEHIGVELCATGNSYSPLMFDAEGTVRGITPTAATVMLERPNGGPPSKYVLQTTGGPVDVAPDQMLHVRLANPQDPWLGLSPLDSLRSLLAEEEAAAAERQGLWKNSLRKDGIIEQDVNAPRMSDEARESFLTDIEQALSGAENTQTPGLLEPGMRWRDTAWSPKEAEYVSARQQSLGLVCGVFGVPSQLVAASTENIRAASAQYEEVLGPWVERIEAALTTQLVPKLYGEDRVQVKLRQPVPIVDKDAGGVLDGAVKSGRLTANEARAVTGLPPIEGGDQLTPAAAGAPA
jgi:HK97 family phage portal protein